jgi:hypothetical protein
MLHRKDYTRREFLRTFAALSSASLLLSVSMGCGNEPFVGGMYGPPPVGSTVVSGIYYVDAQSNNILLQGNQNVPVHTQFVINFSAAMLMSSVAGTINFIDSGNNSIACTKTWDTTNSQNSTIKVIPDSDLLHNESYKLSVGPSAMDSNGRYLNVTADATAYFKTAV